MELTELIDEISYRMRLLRASEEAAAGMEDLTEREALILELINERGRITISEISNAFARVAPSTISTTVTKLWRDKGLVSKSIDPANQRVTTVELTEKGIEAVRELKEKRAERYRVLIEALGLGDEEYEVLKSIISRAVRQLDKVAYG